VRLVVDLQACQTDSRDRGIGRYAMSLVQAMAAELGAEDELVVAIDMADAARAHDVRNELRRRCVSARVVCYGYPSVQHSDLSPVVRRLAGQLRARFFASLKPDALLISSFFETGECFSTELAWGGLGGIPRAVVGYDLIPQLFPDKYLLDGFFVTGWYRERLGELQHFDLVLSISDATKRDLIAHLGMPESKITVIGAGFDETLVCPYDPPSGQRRLHELGVDKPFVLMVGNGDWRKNTIGALHAFAALPLSIRSAHDLVLTQAGADVRAGLDGEFSHLRGSVHVLGRVDDVTLALLYRECRVLYFPSHYEGFGLPVLEAMAFDAPVLSSNAGALPEVVHDSRVLFDAESREQGAKLLSRVLQDAQFREEIRCGAREHALGFSWKKTARRAVDALRALANQKKDEQGRLGSSWLDQKDIALMAEVCIETGSPGEQALERGLRAIARGGKRRILVDITEIIRLDAKSGIQRVTRNFFAGLATVAGEGGAFEVEPFCWTEKGIQYARKYAREILGVSCTGPDESVQVQPSDLVFMLDSSWWSPERFDDLHTRVRVAGGEVVWMVYDLIPIRFPETCDPNVLPVFATWLAHAVRTSDGFICISEATRSDLESFMDGLISSGSRRPWSRSVHLGCDLDPARPVSPSETSVKVISEMCGRPYFSALGTLEPRKDYKTVLDAFEQLWSNGSNFALVIIGKLGWNVDVLVERINRHPERNKRLFWIQNASDGDVLQLLQDSAALIQASISEGFGLPLVEAGSLGVPVIASDIAVFREIGGEHTAYFPVGDAEALADVVTLTAARNKKRYVAPARHRGWHEASAELAITLCPNRSIHPIAAVKRN